MTTEPYRVGDPHPTARRPIQAGDIVCNAAGWPSRLCVVDVDHASGAAELVAAGGVRIRAKLSDLVRIEDAS